MSPAPVGLTAGYCIVATFAGAFHEGFATSEVAGIVYPPGAERELRVGRLVWEKDDGFHTFNQRMELADGPYPDSAEGRAAALDALRLRRAENPVVERFARFKPRKPDSLGGTDSGAHLHYFKGTNKARLK